MKCTKPKFIHVLMIMIISPAHDNNIFIATDKRGYPHNIFLIIDENICSVYSLEAPRRGASNEYPQHMFLLRNKKDISIFRMKKAPYLLLCIFKECYRTLCIRTDRPHQTV